MTSTIPDGMPQLARGAHERGTGYACVMNYLSYLNGDEFITDHPTCTHRALAVAATWLNDNLCGHQDSPFLCGACSASLLGFAGRLFGTGEAGRTSDDRVRIARGLSAWVVASYPTRFPYLRTDTKRAVAAYGAGLIDAKTFECYREYATGTAVDVMRTSDPDIALNCAMDVVGDGLPKDGSLRIDGVAYLDGLLTAHERLTRREAPYEISTAERAKVLSEIGAPRSQPTVQTVPAIFPDHPLFMKLAASVPAFT